MQKNKRRTKDSSRTLGNVDTNIKRSARKYDKPEWVSIPDGESVIGRLVDVGDDFKDGFVHQVPFKGKGGKMWTRDVMCLDQDDTGEPCPGCKDSLDRRYKFWSRFILRDAPKVNAKGKTIGYEDKVVILSSGKRMVGAINKKHKKYDLSKHDIEIEREGEEFETQYEVEVLDPEDPSPLSKADKNLIENSTVSLDRYTTAPDFDDFYSTDDDKDDDEDIGKKSQRRGSSFGSRSKKKSSSDDDDEPSPKKSKNKKKTSGLGNITTTKSSSKRRRR